MTLLRKKPDFPTNNTAPLPTARPLDHLEVVNGNLDPFSGLEFGESFHEERRIKSVRMIKIVIVLLSLRLLLGRQNCAMRNGLFYECGGRLRRSDSLASNNTPLYSGTRLYRISKQSMVRFFLMPKHK